MRDNLNNQLNQIFRLNRHVIAVYIAGSYARGIAGKESDFDLVVAVDDSRLLSEDLVYESVRHLSFPKDLDLSVVDKNSSPLFLFQTISRGERIYEKDNEDAVEFEAQVLHRYYDTDYIRKIYYSHLADKFSYYGNK